MLINLTEFSNGVWGIIDDIKEHQLKIGLKASGKSARSLRPDLKKNPNGVRADIYGHKSFRYQVNGRGPGKYPKPSRLLVEAIKQWTIDKEIKIPAYAIAFKINRDGISVPNRYNPGTVLSNPLAPAKVKARFSPQLKSFYKRVLKQRIHL